VLDTMSLDPDKRMQNASQYHIVRSPVDRLLDANAKYRISLKPTTTTDISLNVLVINGPLLMDTLEGGVAFVQTSRKDGGDWTDNLGQRPMMGIIVTGLDHDISGGSGGGGWEGDP